uniref:Uncharacterized protein n=1 Tax=Anguilla anguilla TaxID=7936 RepID=A0A0E9SKT5_ANGAN
MSELIQGKALTTVSSVKKASNHPQT